MKSDQILHDDFHVCGEGAAEFCSSGPVATLAGVIEDEARLAVLKVSVSLEALEVGGLISRVLVQPIRTAKAKVCSGISGGGGTWCSGGLWSKPYTEEQYGMFRGWKHLFDSKSTSCSREQS